MSYNLVIKPEAAEDAEEAAIWYEEQGPGLGSKFLESLEEKLTTIELNPQLFEIKYNDIRQAFLSRFPFAIHYLFDNNSIFVLAILHTRVNPEQWKQRK